MRKYAALDYIFSQKEGATAREISEYCALLLPNTYAYLSTLQRGNLVYKKGKRYLANSKNPKVKQLLRLRHIYAREYLFLISPTSREILTQLAKSLELDVSRSLGRRYIRHVRRLHKLKIVFIVKKRPVKCCLRLNEDVTSLLLEYLNLKVEYALEKYNDYFSRISPPHRQVIPLSVTSQLSDPRVKGMCDKYHEENKDYFLGTADGYAPDKHAARALADINKANKGHVIYLQSLPKEKQLELFNQFLLEYVYNTNRIEGNALTLEQVSDYITGRGIPDTSNKDLNETMNTKEAFEWMLANMGKPFDQSLVETLHFFTEKNISSERGRYKRIYNHVGGHPTTPPKAVPMRMKQLFKWYNKNEAHLNPIILASVVHQQFVMIHPFADGNGRVARLIFNFIILKKGYLPIIFKADSKQGYYQAIENRSLCQFLLYLRDLFKKQLSR